MNFIEYFFVFVFKRLELGMLQTLKPAFLLLNWVKIRKTS